MSAPQHDCSLFLTYDAAQHEIICTKCGIVIDDEQLKAQYYAEISELSENANSQSRLTAEDHNAGNDLFDSITQQQDYVSLKNPGVAFQLSGTKGKDHAGKRIKRQIQGDGYKAGNIAGEKGAYVKEDPITGDRTVVFSRYNVTLINLWKHNAEPLCTSYGLDTIDKSRVAGFLKRKYSRLLMPGAISSYVIKAAMLDADVLKGKEKEELEKSMYQDLDRVRLLLLSRGESSVMKEMQEQESTASIVQPMKA